MPRELPPALKLYQEFVKFLTEDLKIKGGIEINQLAAKYKKLAVEKEPGMKEPEIVLKKTKEIYLEDKKIGGPMKKLEEIRKQNAENRIVKKLAVEKEIQIQNVINYAVKYARKEIRRILSE